MRIKGRSETTVIRRVCALLIALALVFVCSPLSSPARADGDGMVRVRLTRLGAPAEITMKVDCEYYLAADPTVRIEPGETVTVSAGTDGLALKSGRLRVALGDTARLMRAQSGNRGIQFLKPELSNRFCGDLGLSASGGVISAVLNIYVENYLYGVVGYAMAPSAGLEALKAQAVAARTYALRKRANRSDAAYDLTDTAADQVFKGYNGTSDYANVVRAVDETRGGVLYYGNSLAQCYCCASNGGQTESARNAWGTGLAYTRVKDDPYDFESASAAVKTAVINKDLTELNPLLKTALVEGMRAKFAEQGLSTNAADIHVNAIESITACESLYPAPSRLYKRLTFKLNVTGTAPDGQTHTGSVSVGIPTYGGFEDWYELSLNPESNETIWVSESERAFTVSFRRSGAGVGLSQRGAQVMAANYGMKAADILKFYYPDTEPRRLDLNDATRDMRAVEPARDQAVIAASRLKDKTDLLSAPDGDATPTASVAAGAAVDIYGVQGDWIAVGSSGKYGYVRAESLESFTLAGADVIRAEEKTYGKLREGAQILQLPLADAQVVETIGGANAVRVFAWTSAWVLVETPNGQRGFAAMADVDLSAMDTADAPAQANASAAGETREGARVQLNRDATLYEQPDDMSVPLGMLKRGEIVTALAGTGEWIQVTTSDGVTGWLKAAWVAAAADAPEGGAIHRVRGRKYMFVSAAMASVYQSWFDSSPVLCTMCHGDRVRVGAYNDRWICVRANGVTGYVRAEALSSQRPAAVEGGYFTRPKAEIEAVAVRDGVAVYPACATGSGALAEMQQGQRLRVAAYNAAWALCRAGDAVGFARVEDLVPSGSAAEVALYDAVANANAVVYASAKGRSIGQIAQGAVVRVIATRGEYACIEYNGKKAFVKTKFLDRK